MNNFKNSPLSKAMNNKTNLVEVLIIAFFIALGTSVLASGLISISFLNGKHSIWIGLGIVGLAFLFLVLRMFNNSEYTKKTTANIVYDIKKDEIVRIKNYEYSEKICDYLEYAFNESEDIKAIWQRNTLNETENNQEKSKSMELIEEVTEYNLLDTVSEHLNSYFNGEYIGEDNVTVINRNDISELIMKNKFLELFSKPMDERSAFLNGKETSIAQASSQKNLYNKFELKVPKNSQLKRENDGSITIKNKRFTLNFTVDFTGKTSTEMPPDYLSKFHNLDKHEFIQYEIDISVKIKFSNKTFSSSKGWEYYNWLDSLIKRIEDDFCPIKFKEEINWKSNQLILDYLDNHMPNTLEKQKLHNKENIKPLKVKNKKTYIFYANAKFKKNLWIDSDTSSYHKDYLKSKQSTSVVEELAKYEKEGNLEDLDILGVYFKDDENLKYMYKLKLKNFKENANDVSFDFINLKEIPIKSSDFLKAIDRKHSYHDGEPQLIVSVEENIDDLLKRV